MTFDEALAQLEIAARAGHGATVENLVARLRTGEISKERFVSEIRAPGQPSHLTTAEVLAPRRLPGGAAVSCQLNPKPSPPA
jgi:hypothetical protein